MPSSRKGILGFLNASINCALLTFVVTMYVLRCTFLNAHGATVRANLDLPANHPPTNWPEAHLPRTLSHLEWMMRSQRAGAHLLAAS